MERVEMQLRFSGVFSVWFSVGVGEVYEAGEARWDAGGSIGSSSKAGRAAGRRAGNGVKVEWEDGGLH
jgi:hypothetical protein